MKIQKTYIQWRYTLTPLELSKVDSIALHHMAHPTADLQTVHGWHLQRDNNTWAGFGYNYWIDFDGQIWEGRGLNQGAGVAGENNHVISIGFQGNYEPYRDVRGNMIPYKTEMPKLQFDAGVWLIERLREMIPTIKTVEGHRYWGGTTCPGKYFPLEQMKGGISLTWEQKAVDFVKKFQKGRGLVVDGKAGTNTNKELDAVFSLLSDLEAGKGNYPRIELKQKGGIKYVEIDPFKMGSVDADAYAVDLVKHYPNFTGGMFSHPGGRLISLLVVNGKKVYAPRWYDRGDKGTFIVYNSGKVEVISTKDIKDVSGIKLAFQGFNCDYEVNGSKKLYDSIRKEFWQPDVYRECWRVGWGYNYRINKAVAVFTNGDADDLRNALRLVGCTDVNGNTCGVGVDAGKMTACAVNSQLIVVGDNGRVGKLEHIITF